MLTLTFTAVLAASNKIPVYWDFLKQRLTNNKKSASRKDVKNKTSASREDVKNKTSASREDVKNCHRKRFISALGWTDIDLCKKAVSQKSLERQASFSKIYTKHGMSHRIAEFGSDHFFEIYKFLCGVSIEGVTVTLSWATIKPYMERRYRHRDILTCKHFTKETLVIVKVSILADEYEIGLEFERPEGRRKLKAFSDLVRNIVPRPVHGEQLMCYVKGDNYLTGILKYYFIRQVFGDTGVQLGSSRFSDLEPRLESCRKLQGGFDASIDAFSIHLAEAGYFLTNDSNLAQCFKCGGILQLKKFDFDPWEDHAYWHPSCPFLLEARGKQFVEKVRHSLKLQCDFDTECVFTFKIRKLAPVQPTYGRRSLESDSNDETSDDSEDSSSDDDIFGPDTPASDYFSDFDEEL